MIDSHINADRKIHVGAEILPEGGVHFRVWAPGKKSVEVVIEKNILPSLKLNPEDHGYFSGFLPDAKEGTLYKFKLDDSDSIFPDPASRYQPSGPHGFSRVINPDAFTWKDNKWNGISIHGQVVYEIHVGTFTQEGTWNAAIEHLPELADLGITVIEIMPVADFPGKFGWGYDGVNLFAPTHLYGTPDDFREFVNQAHLIGIAVILDVVYNHLGPDGNYLKEFSPYYFSKKYKTDWGEAINFDGENSEPVRNYFISNAGYWITEFHLDGLRLDATQNIYDTSANHILAEISRTVRKSAINRSVILIAENESQNTRLQKSLEENGFGIDAAWNDDFHHSAMVALTGRSEAYYTDYYGKPQEFISAIKYGYLFQGQWYKWQGQRRGTSTRGLGPERFVNFIQNHDQIANSGRGFYCHKLTSPGCFKAMTSLLLLSPQTPMIFQGQEFAASNPFFYFADLPSELSKLVTKGRIQFLAQFRSLALPETQACLPIPSDPETFIKSKLNFNEREINREIFLMHKDLLALRKKDYVIAQQGKQGLDGAVLNEYAFIIRYFSEDNLDRLLVINFGRDLNFNPAPEPLLAPPFDYEWEIIFSTEDLKYGGIGTAPLDTEENWKIPGHSGVLLKPVKSKENYHEGIDKENLLD